MNSMLDAHFKDLNSLGWRFESKIGIYTEELRPTHSRRMCGWIANLVCPLLLTSLWLCSCIAALRRDNFALHWHRFRGLQLQFGGKIPHLGKSFSDYAEGFRHWWILAKQACGRIRLAKQWTISTRQDHDDHDHSMATLTCATTTTRTRQDHVGWPMTTKTCNDWWSWLDQDKRPRIPIISRMNTDGVFFWYSIEATGFRNIVQSLG